MSEVKIIKSGPRVRCKHFAGMTDETCLAGVKFTDVRKEHAPLAYRHEFSRTEHTHTRSLPCLPDYNLGGATCDKCQFPTAEEVAAEEREAEESMARVNKARAAIVAHLGGPWKKGKPGAKGRIDCPCCGKPGALAFSRSGYNGHVAARCETANCCNWME